MKAQISAKWRRMQPLYRRFAAEWSALDFSEEAAREMYAHESTGGPVDRTRNGYWVGKRWLNVTVAMWLEDIRSGLLFKFELYEDPGLPNWWLDGVLAGVRQGHALCGAGASRPDTVATSS